MLKEKLLWEGKTRHAAAPVLPDAPPQAASTPAARDSCVLLSLAPSGGIRDPHPPGLPRSPLTSSHGPQDAAGGEVSHGQPAAQLAQLHVHQLRVLEENCGRERGRERESSVSAGLREGWGHCGHLDPPALTRRLRHLDVPGRDGPWGLMGGGKGGNADGGRGGAGAILGVSGRHVGCVTVPSGETMAVPVLS